MSTFAFNATCVAIGQPDGEFDLVGFADRKFGPKYYFMLQRAFEFDEQDVSLGMDTYHIEWSDQGSSGYGGVSRATLSRSSIEFAFDATGAEFLDGLETLKISFELQADQFAELRQALERVFQGSNCLLLADA